MAYNRQQRLTPDQWEREFRQRRLEATQLQQNKLQGLRVRMTEATRLPSVTAANAPLWQARKRASYSQELADAYFNRGQGVGNGINI